MGMKSRYPESKALSLATSHYENFTVMSLLLPRNLRQDVANLYAYCRTVDDLGDEATGDRLALLAEWERDLLACFTGTPSHPILRALQSTIHKHHLAKESFLRLIEANRRDQVKNRYQTWDELLEYCHYSANPVGELYLHLLGYTDDKRIELSNATCTALQLVNFWQDISRDAAKGRIYIPLANLDQAGVTENDILNGINSPASAQLLRDLCSRTAALFNRGLGLLSLLPPRHAYNVRLFSLGGTAILRVVMQNCDRIFTFRPTLSKADKCRLALKALLPVRNPTAIIIDE